MRAETILLKLVLDAVGCRVNTHFKPDLKYISNIIYLIQTNGANLGYDFKWNDEDKHPISRDLSGVYYDLIAGIDAGEKDYVWYKLDTDEAHDAIEKTKRMMIVPYTIPADVSTWIAYLAAAHYLHKSPHRPDDVTDDDIFNYLREHYKNISFIGTAPRCEP